MAAGRTKFLVYTKAWWAGSRTFPRRIGRQERLTFHRTLPQMGPPEGEELGVPRRGPLVVSRVYPLPRLRRGAAPAERGAG